MERDMNQAPQQTVCRGGCGFYGSSATEGLCSKCFKDTLKRKQDPGRISPSSSASQKSNESVVTAHAVTSTIENLVAPIQATCSSTSTGGASSIATAIETVPMVMESGMDTPTPSSSSLVSLGSLSSASSDQQTVDSDVEKAAASAPSASAPKQKNRCDQCRKRVGLTGFECRCGGMYCAMHRYSDMHQCAFDYKALGEQEIRKNNPVVKTEKVQKL